MFDLAELQAGILEDFAELQGIVSDPDDIQSEIRAVKWRRYQREWIQAKRARLAKYPPRFCLCCGKVLPKHTTGRKRHWCGESCRCKFRRNNDNRAN